MEDFQQRLTINISGKTRTAMFAFLKKHGHVGEGDVSRFIEDAITWRILDRQIASRKGGVAETAILFSDGPQEQVEESLSA